MLLLANIVTTSKALVTSIDALVTSSFLLLVAIHFAPSSDALVSMFADFGVWSKSYSGNSSNPKVRTEFSRCLPETLKSEFESKDLNQRIQNNERTRRQSKAFTEALQQLGSQCFSAFWAQKIST